MKQKPRARKSLEGSSSGFRQLQAVLWKQWLMKKRYWSLTAMELLTPLLIVSILVMAYKSANPEYWPPRIRSGDTDMTLNEMYTEVEDLSSSLPEGCYETLRKAEIEARETNATLSAMIASKSGASNDTAQTLVDHWSSDEEEKIKVCAQALRASSPGVTKLLTNFMIHLTDRNGPLPIPTLDEFILVHELLQSGLHTSDTFMRLVHQAQLVVGRHSFGNLLDLGNVAFAPATPEVKAFSSYMLKSHRLFGRYFHGVFESEGEAERFIESSSQQLWALVIFHKGPNMQGIEYTIRMAHTSLPNAAQKIDRHNRGVPSNAKQYLTSGFLSLQSAIEAYPLHLAPKDESGLEVPDPIQGASVYTVWITAFPQAAYLFHNFYTASGPLLGLLMSLSLIFPISQLVRGFVEEKEDGTHELMAVMGLKAWVGPLSWALTYSVVFGIISVGLAVMCYTSFFSATSFSLLLCILLLFTLSEVAFAIMIGSVFKNASLAAIVAPLLHCACVMPRYVFFRTDDSDALLGKLAASLLSPSAFAFASDLAMLYEGGGNGLTWGQLWGDGLPLGALMLIIIFDALLYSILAVYLQILFSPASTGLPFYFPLTASYWRSLKHPSTTAAKAKAESEASGDGDAGLASLKSFEGIKTQGLTKMFRGKVAVKDLSMEMRVGEVTALLGHNGAGKSTLVSMMTGQVVPTQGDCLVWGKSMQRDTAEARKHIGFCPQSNVMYSRLTVLEHLQLYAAVKGVKGGAFGKKAMKMATTAMKDLGLLDKANTEARALSGGMKRKLQVAMAILGNSTALILDEPTTGVDPASRRAFWKILAEIQPGYATLLITQFPDEAESLADQVAIMYEGEIVSSGSPLEIRARHNQGLHLKLNLEASSNSRTVVELVGEFVKEAEVLRQAAAELCVKLPVASTHSLIPLLQTLEKRQSELGITSMSVSLPNLEEAFIQVLSKASAMPPEHLEGDALQPSKMTALPFKHQETLAANCAIDRQQGASSRFWVAFRQMVWKRSIISRRDMRTVLWANVMPLIAICVVSLMIALTHNPWDHSMHLDLASNQQTGPIATLGLPAALQACSGSALYVVDGPCKGGLAFLDRGPRANNDSMDMSKVLLEDLDRRKALQDVALVFDDIVVQKVKTHKVIDALIEFSRLLRSVNVGWLQKQLAPLLALLTPSQSNSIPDSQSKSIPDSQQTLIDSATAELLESGAVNSSQVEGLKTAAKQSQHLMVMKHLRQRVSRAGASVTLMYNASAYHVLPAALSGLHQSMAILKDSGSKAPKFVAYSRPLPLTAGEVLDSDKLLFLLAAIFMLIPFCLLTGAFCMNIVAESRNGFKHLQILSGCPTLAYWAGSFAWDYATHCSICLASVTLLAFLGNQIVIASAQQAIGTLLVFLVYGLAVLPLTYCLARCFTSVPTAQVCLSAFTFVVGACAIIAVKVLDKMAHAKALLAILRPLLRTMPPFLLGEALCELTNYYYKSFIAQAPQEAGEKHAHDIVDIGSLYDWHVLGRPLTYSFMEFCIFSTVLLILEQGQISAGIQLTLSKIHSVVANWLVVVKWNPLQRLPENFVAASHPHIDSDVRQQGKGASAAVRDEEVQYLGNLDRSWDLERASAAGEQQTVVAEFLRCSGELGVLDPIRLQQLNKVYASKPPKVALKELCLSVRPGERLGLLGENGAGKTSLMEILCGRSSPTSGDAVILGQSITQARQSGTCLKGLGYCPQVDPVSHHMTAREQLSMFARLKGVRGDDVEAAVDDALQRVSLPREMSRRAALEYSGGSKRKLALGIALIGDTQTLLLDEPSSGMDPVSRRLMWDFVLRATEPRQEVADLESGACIRLSTMLTTHSMEECEALCNRVAILHKGRLLCVATPAQLRATYCPHTSLTVCLDRSDAEDSIQQTQEVVELLERKLSATLTSSCGTTLSFSIANQEMPLSSVLRTLQLCKKMFRVQAYSVSQSSLEEVFLTATGGNRA